MKKNLSLAVLLTLVLLITMACQSASTANSTADNLSKTNAPKTNNAPKTDEHGHADDAPRITLADAKKDFDAGTAVFVDTRADAAYKNERIKGAINLTMGDVEARYKELPTNKKIIAYCS
jgi:3-mercaptopyruvate sulfurtransferase SseA